jgi:hypothetical protein
VTPQKGEARVGGQSFFHFQYIAEDKSGPYLFAEQDSGDVEPKVKSAPEYFLKEPVDVGNSWYATLDLGNGHSVPARATIESTDEPVDVPAGTFTHCVKVHIVATAKTAAGQDEYQWLAPSIGLVKDISRAAGTSAQLVSFTK